MKKVNIIIESKALKGAGSPLKGAMAVHKEISKPGSQTKVVDAIIAQHVIDRAAAKLENASKNIEAAIKQGKASVFEDELIDIAAAKGVNIISGKEKPVLIIEDEELDPITGSAVMVQHTINVRDGQETTKTIRERGILALGSSVPDQYLTKTLVVEPSQLKKVLQFMIDNGISYTENVKVNKDTVLADLLSGVLPPAIAPMVATHTVDVLKVSERKTTK